MKALIDADILVYRCGYAAQRTSWRFVKNDGSKIDFDGTKNQVLKKMQQLELSRDQGKLQKLVCPEPEEHAYRSVKLSIEGIVEATRADTYELFLTSNDKSNYRFNIAKTLPYKGNRKQAKPVHYDGIREYLQTVWGAVIVSDKEADDEMGIQQTEDSIICTIDKDLDMIPGKHYNFVTDTLYETSDPGELELYKENRRIRGGGLKWFYAQMLLGDSADNIPGIGSYGPVKVSKALSKADTEEKMVKVVWGIYKKALPPQEAQNRFLEVADLLWIQREVDQCKSEQIKSMLI